MFYCGGSDPAHQGLHLHEQSPLSKGLGNSFIRNIEIDQIFIWYAKISEMERSLQLLIVYLICPTHLYQSPICSLHHFYSIIYTIPSGKKNWITPQIEVTILQFNTFLSPQVLTTGQNFRSFLFNNKDSRW